MNVFESDLERRFDEARHSGEPEIKRLEQYFAAKDGPNANELAASRRGIIDAAYEAIGIARERLQQAAPGETISWPVWWTHVESGKEIAGGMIKKGMVAGYTAHDAILMHPDLLTVLTPREIAAVYAHEAGHDIDNLKLRDKRFAKQAE